MFIICGVWDNTVILMIRSLFQDVSNQYMEIRKAQQLDFYGKMHPRRANKIVEVQKQNWYWYRLPIGSSFESFLKKTLKPNPQPCYLHPISHFAAQPSSPSHDPKVSKGVVPPILLSPAVAAALLSALTLY